MHSYHAFKTYINFSKNISIHHTEIPKKALLQKISLLRLERQAAKTQNDSGATAITTTDRLPSTIYPTAEPISANSNAQPMSKRQLILSTIEDLKRSLEDQSIELCGMNEDD